MYQVNLSMISTLCDPPQALYNCGPKPIYLQSKQDGLEYFIITLNGQNESVYMYSFKTDKFEIFKQYPETLTPLNHGHAVDPETNNLHIFGGDKRIYATLKLNVPTQTFASGWNIKCSDYKTGFISKLSKNKEHSQYGLGKLYMDRPEAIFLPTPFNQLHIFSNSKQDSILHIKYDSIKQKFIVVSELKNLKLFPASPVLYNETHRRIIMFGGFNTITFKSQIWYCNHTALISISYNTPNCNNTDDQFEIKHYTHECTENNTHRSIIQCKNTSLDTISPSIMTTPSPASGKTTKQPTISDERIYYVSSTGWDTTSCTSQPCGTLWKAVYEASLSMAYSSAKIKRVEVIVQGQNHKQLEQRRNLTGDLGGNPCLPQQFIPQSTYFDHITITFDSNYIHSMSDWYPKKICENITGVLENSFFVSPTNGIYTLVLNNFVFDSYTFEGRNTQPIYIARINTFICNNCTFSNITITYEHHKIQTNQREPTLVLSSNMSLRNCTFSNIIYQPSAEIDKYKYDYAFFIVDVVSTTPQNNIYIFESVLSSGSFISNVYNLGKFIYYRMDSYLIDFAQVDILIEDVTFDDIFSIDAILYIDPGFYINGNINVKILSSNFFNINFGSILYSFQYPSIIDISKVNISTAQTITQYFNITTTLKKDRDDYYSLFVIEPTRSIININHTNIKYIYAQYIDTNCIGIYGSILQAVMIWHTIEESINKEFDFYAFQYACDIPIQFLDTQCVTNINYLTVSNDFTDAIYESIRKDVIKEINLYELYLGYEPKKTLYLDFEYQVPSDTEDKYAMIYNDGEVNIQSFYIFGVSAHNTMILSPNGNLYVDDMITIIDIHCDGNYECSFNPDMLTIHSMIRFNEQHAFCKQTVLNISNSFLFGSAGASVGIGGGYAYLHNLTIKMSLIGIQIAPDNIYTQIIDCEMNDIGPYYSSSTFILESGRSPFGTPFVFLSQELFVKNTVFSYVAPFQFSFFDATNYFLNQLILTGDISFIKKVKLINNTFIVNDENVLYPYPLNDTLEFMVGADFWEFWDDNYSVRIDPVKAFYVNGTVEITNNMQITLINNRFMVDEDNNIYVFESTLMDNNIPLIYIDNNDGITCVSGNEFNNFAIWLNRGNITSCIKSEMNEYFGNTECESSLFGSIDIDALDYTSNIFNINYNISSIINVADQSFISLYDTIINPINSVMNSLVIKSGNMLLKDTIIINSTYHQNKNINTIKIDNTHCNVICLELMNYNPNLIATLHAMCNTSMHINNTNNNMVSLIDEYMYSFEDVTHWMPWMININTKNDEYFPGGTLDLIYNIIDKENNSIETVNTPINIYIESTNPQELFLNEQIEISENGECPQCKIYIQSSSITQIGNQYSLKLSVINYNLLLVNPFINITIIECPSGSGVTGNALQCEECKIEYFSLLPTTSSCMKCNNNINGVTCFGTNNIHIEQDYWIAVYQYTQLIHDKYFSAVNGTVNHNNHIISGSCPPGYCCKLETGCNFITDSNVLCAPYRDPNVVLCGKCLDGYSELLFSTSCGLCKHSAWYIIIYPILLALLWALFILITKSTSTSSHKPIAVDANDNDDESNNSSSCCKQICRCTCRSNDSNSNKVKYMSKKRFLNIIEVMIIINLTYYYQTVMNIVSVTNGLPTALIGFMGIFNIDVFSMI
eukprot:31574_1